MKSNLKQFDEKIRETVLLFDGSMGALLSSMGHASECPELFNVEDPKLIQSIHQQYMEAGAKVLITNSLGSNPIKLGRVGLSGRSKELTQAAVQNARAVAQDQAYVALDVGPTGEFLAPLGTMTLEDMIEAFSIVCQAGREAGADLILLETMTDIAEARAACLAARETGLPICASFTFEPNGHTLTGGSPECAALCLQAVGARVMGINCSGGPVEMLAPLDAMRRVCALPIVVQPNAGLPQVDAEGNAHYRFSAQDMAPLMQDILSHGASAIGGCCGTTPEHIRLMAPLTGGPVPQPKGSGVGYVCSSRRVRKAEEALAGAVEIEDVDDLYDLEAEDSAAILSLSGLSPNQAVQLINDAQAATKKPLLLRATQAEPLRQALRHYAGVAGVFSGNELLPVLTEYGAFRIE